MNIEEIKLITEAVTSLGAQGKEAFIWWLVMDKGLAFVEFIVFFFSVYKLGFHLVKAGSREKDIKRLYCKASNRDAPYSIDEEHILVIEKALDK